MKLEEFLADASPSDVAPLLPVEHLSVSQLQMLARCPEQWRNRYVLGKKQRPGGAQILGSAFHVAQEQNFRSQIAHREFLNVELLADIYNGEWEDQVQRAGGVSEVSWDSREKPDTTRLNGEIVTKLYAERVAPKYQPEEVEHEFSLDIPGVPVPVVGKIDLLGSRYRLESAENIHDGAFSIAADYKTSARAQRELKPDWKLQGEVYMYAAKRPVEWHVVVKGSKPNVITPLDAPGLFQFEEPGTAAFVERKFKDASRQIAWLMAEYGPDEPWPTTGYSHPFACGYCGFRPGCIAWSRS